MNNGLPLISYKPYSNANKKINSNAPWSQRKKKELIVNQTLAERFFYDAFKRVSKKRIQPQKVIRIKKKRYFLDFYLPFKKVAVEIDGGYHLNQVLKDKERDAELLLHKKIRTIRVTNAEVLNDPHIYVEKLFLLLNTLKDIK